MFSFKLKFNTSNWVYSNHGIYKNITPVYGPRKKLTMHTRFSLYQIHDLFNTNPHLPYNAFQFHYYILRKTNQLNGPKCHLTLPY